MPTISEGSRKRAEDVSIVYHIYLRVQGPESRVQSPESSPLLDYTRLFYHFFVCGRCEWQAKPAEWEIPFEISILVQFALIYRELRPLFRWSLMRGNLFILAYLRTVNVAYMNVLPDNSTTLNRLNRLQGETSSTDFRQRREFPK